MRFEPNKNDATNGLRSQDMVTALWAKCKTVTQKTVLLYTMLSHSTAANTDTCGSDLPLKTTISGAQKGTKSILKTRKRT